MAATAPFSVLLALACPECGPAAYFEQPPCADQHDPCPEVVCVTCGLALVLGGPFPLRAARAYPLAKSA